MLIHRPMCHINVPYTSLPPLSNAIHPRKEVAPTFDEKEKSGHESSETPAPCALTLQHHRSPLAHGFSLTSILFFSPRSCTGPPFRSPVCPASLQNCSILSQRLFPAPRQHSPSAHARHRHFDSGAGVAASHTDFFGPVLSPLGLPRHLAGATSLLHVSPLVQSHRAGCQIFALQGLGVRH